MFAHRLADISDVVTALLFMKKYIMEEIEREREGLKYMYAANGQPSHSFTLF